MLERHGPPVLGGIVLLLVWEFLPAALNVSKLLLPPPSSIARSMWLIYERGLLVENFLVTLAEALLGFAIGSVTASTTSTANIPEMSMLKLSCGSKLPRPRSAPMNSPTIAPVMLRTMATFSPAKMKGSEFGKITMRNVCQREATSERIRSIFSASTIENHTMELISTGKNEMIAAIRIFDSIPIPTQTTIRGEQLLSRLWLDRGQSQQFWPR